MSNNKIYLDPREPIVTMGKNLNAMLANNNVGFRSFGVKGFKFLLGMTIGLAGFIVTLFGAFGLSSQGHLTASIAVTIIGCTIFIAGIRLAMNWPQKRGGIFPAWFIGLFGLFQIVATVVFWSELYIRGPYMPLFSLCFGLSYLYFSYRIINPFSTNAISYFYESKLMYEIAKIYELGHGSLAGSPLVLIRKASDEFEFLIKKNNQSPFKDEAKRLVSFSRNEFNRRVVTYLTHSERRQWLYGS